MCEIRNTSGKPVILVGDLNISRRPEDTYWGSRVLHVPTFLALKGLRPEEEIMQETLRREWGGIKEMLSNAEARATKVQTSYQVRKSQLLQPPFVLGTLQIPCDWNMFQGDLSKFKLYVKGRDGKFVGLGKPCESKEEAEAAYKFTGKTVEESKGNGERTPEPFVVRHPEEMTITAVTECLRAYTGIECSEKQGRVLARTAVARSSPPCREWIESLLSEDDMCDTFAEMYPLARGRFTCWDQYKNRRYCNQASAAICEQCSTRLRSQSNHLSFFL